MSSRPRSPGVTRFHAKRAGRSPRRTSTRRTGPTTGTASARSTAARTLARFAGSRRKRTAVTIPTTTTIVLARANVPVFA